VSVQKFTLFLLFLTIQAPAATIYLQGDEVTLPPLLNEVYATGHSEDRINVTAEDQHPYEAQKGEWLGFGDTFDKLPPGLAIQVIVRESIQWVGGGVFTGKVGSGSVVSDDRIYELTVSHGWAKVWIRKDSNRSILKIHSEAGDFTAQSAIFWMSVRPDHTEIYLIDGELTFLPGSFTLRNRSYAVFEKGKDKPPYVSKDWDPGAMEVKIAASYPHFIKLAGVAGEEWEDGKVSRTYATYRKKGWRKAAHLDPLSK
jgi:hypothetical protein